MTPKDYDSLSWPGRFSRGDKQALADAMDYYGTDVLRLVKRILGGCGRAEDAEECVSDVFLAAWNNIGQYDPDRASFRTWILILAKYKALNLRRKLQPGLDQTMGQAAIPVRSSSNTEQEILRREAAEELLHHIKQLQEPDRSLFLRRYYLYESLDELAEAFDLTKKAVENRLYRCRTILKQTLQQTKPNREEDLGHEERVDHR
ncbi:sigma-70 family RNA polymerase sigma factor [Paenibacillus sp. FSL H7-0350]|uniref:sigma-70 family RNA polymerase sigma factor n=1 Tax=Paenibacillus sp. FSL H7-0350 TaxID=2975345 RepID=UPI003158ECD0